MRKGGISTITLNLGCIDKDKIVISCDAVRESLGGKTGLADLACLVEVYISI